MQHPLRPKYSWEKYKLRSSRPSSRRMRTEKWIWRKNRGDLAGTIGGPKNNSNLRQTQGK